MKLQKGTRVLVTAGASGIGRSIVETFYNQGAAVHVCDISDNHLPALLKDFPGIGFTQTDVSVPMEVDNLFEEGRTNLKGLDVLINNVGIAGPTARVENVSPEEWSRTLEVNVTGHFLCVRQAVPLLREAGGGSIVNLSSVAGRLGYPMRTPYAASKWAIVGFTQSLAMELGHQKIRVNALLPGTVEGERIHSVIQARAKISGTSFEDMEEKVLQQSSLHRMVSASEIADMALFLCSETGRSISGQAISVCGNVERLV